MGAYANSGRAAGASRAAHRKASISGWLAVEDHRYTLAKFLLLAMLALFVISAFSSQSAKNVDVNVIRAQLSADASIAALQEQDANAFQREMGEDLTGASQWCYLSAASMMDVSELVIVRALDQDELQRMEDAVNAHLAAQKDRFRNYGTNQYELLEHAVLLTRGDYLFYAVSESVDRWEEMFLACIR